MAVNTTDALSEALQSLTLAEVTSLNTEELGRGAYGKVFKVKYKGVVYAAKEIHALLIELSGINEKEKIKKDFLRECYNCSTLRHSNIVKFVGIYYSKENSFLPVMVMELMGESLTKYVKQSNITMQAKFLILNNVASGLNYLHARNPPIVHRDLSPNNILMSLDHNPVAKISDLGVAKIVKADSKATKSIIQLTKAPGTADFMPPECLVDNPMYDTSLDVFSFAGIMLHVINQEWPTPTVQVSLDLQTGNLIARNEVERRQVYIDKIKGIDRAKVLQPLIKECLQNIASKRPLISDLLKRLEQLSVSSVEIYSSWKLYSVLESAKLNRNNYCPDMFRSLY